MSSVEQVWQNYYHFSPMREGLLSWYEFRENATVLEWNPEKGALSGWLADHCQTLTCVVKDEAQRQLLQTRLDGKTNVQMVSEQETENNLQGIYDYVVAINPFATTATEAEMVRTFRRWKEMLSLDGKVLLVMNNRLSINNQAGIKNVRGKETDKATLQNDLENIFPSVLFFYVFSDFVFPQMVYSDKNLPGYGVVERIIPYARNIEFVEANCDELYRMAANNHVLSQMANSFFVECGTDDRTSEIVSATITAERGNYALVTRIRETGVVEKVALNNKSAEHIEKVGKNMQMLKEQKISVVPFEVEKGIMRMPFIEAPVMTEWFKTIVRRSVEEFLELFDKLYNTILSSSSHADPRENALLQDYGEQEWGPVLKNTYVEMTPLNCFWVDGELCFFDQEYVLHNYPAKYVVFRSLAHLYYMDDVFEKYIPLETMKAKYGLTNLWEIFAQVEEVVLKNIRGEEQNADFYKVLTLNNQCKYNEFRNNWNIHKICYLAYDAVNKKIALWGTGNYFAHFMNEYGKWMRVDFAVDTNENLWGTRKQGVLIKNPEALRGENVRVIITCSAKDEVIQRLKELDISDFKVFPVEEEVIR